MGINGLLGLKLDQTQTFNDKGDRIPVTKIDFKTCRVMAILPTKNQDKYKIQIGFGINPKANKPTLGKIKGAEEKTAPRFFKEFVIDTKDELQPGMFLNVADFLKAGDLIKISGVSKGKGFAGGVKRHHFKGGPNTHGQSDRERAPGSIGATTTPGRVYKGKRMAGRMGGENVTIKGLKVISVDKENNILTVMGLVPGVKGGLLTIYKNS